MQCEVELTQTCSNKSWRIHNFIVRCRRINFITEYREMEIKKVEVDVADDKNHNQLDSIGINNAMHIKNDNRKGALRVELWNCRRGLLDSIAEGTPKLFQILDHLTKDQPQVLTLI